MPGTFASGYTGGFGPPRVYGPGATSGGGTPDISALLASLGGGGGTASGGALPGMPPTGGGFVSGSTPFRQPSLNSGGSFDINSLLSSLSGMFGNRSGQSPGLDQGIMNQLQGLMGQRVGGAQLPQGLLDSIGQLSSKFQNLGQLPNLDPATKASLDAAWKAKMGELNLNANQARGGELAQLMGQFGAGGTAVGPNSMAEGAMGRLNYGQGVLAQNAAADAAMQELNAREGIGNRQLQGLQGSLGALLGQLGPQAQLAMGNQGAAIGQNQSQMGGLQNLLGMLQNQGQFNANMGMQQGQMGSQNMGNMLQYLLGSQGQNQDMQRFMLQMQQQQGAANQAQSNWQQMFSQQNQPMRPNGANVPGMTPPQQNPGGAFQTQPGSGQWNPQQNAFFQAYNPGMTGQWNSTPYLEDQQGLLRYLMSLNAGAGSYGGGGGEPA